MSRMLIVLGAVLLLAGLFWGHLSKIPLGRLPGDIVIQKKNITFMFPVMTSILASLILSAVLWFLSRK
ncbi:MAG: DUF2905 domain-containing protein [Candidatus Omnitrophica bacterium]|nr:DUF2905 domain-containing protein [Candidatus Omnitrophota bacterium]MDD5574252.1 DUF2905 domain-containing protein [Candidatus Omnitrophota bacterium]